MNHSTAVFWVGGMLLKMSNWVNMFKKLTSVPLPFLVENLFAVVMTLPSILAMSILQF